MPFSAFPTFSESFFWGGGGRWRKDLSFPVAPWIFWGFVGNIGEKGEGLLPGLFALRARTCHPTRLFPGSLRGAEVAGAGDTNMWHPGQPRRAPSGSSPDFKSRKLKKKQQQKNLWGGGRRGCIAPGPPGRAFPGWVFFLFFFLVLLFLLKYERPFQRSLLCCDYPRAIKKGKKKKHTKKITLQIPTTAFVHQSSCSQAPTE